MEPRHAFLVIAHNHWEQLKTLISLLDHPRVDFYLHIDAKASSFRKEFISPCVKKGKLFFIPRRKVNWGGCSQIRCELDLIGAALPGNYLYYHLISGADLPLKPVEEILSFFEERAGMEFISFSSPALSPDHRYRLSLYYPLQEWVASSSLAAKIQWRLMNLQKKMGVDRLKGKDLPLGKGSNWFSCTHAFLQALWQDRRSILRRYRFTSCCDEIFLQSFLLSSPFLNSLYDTSFSDSCVSNMRFIDWKRGSPYTFHSSDLEELLSSPYLFARKFNEEVDSEVVKAIAMHLTCQSEKV